MYIGYQYVFLTEMSIQILRLFFNWIIWFFGVELYKFFINFECQPLIRCLNEYILLLSGLVFFFFHFGRLSLF